MKKILLTNRFYVATACIVVLYVFLGNYSAGFYFTTALLLALVVMSVFDYSKLSKASEGLRVRRITTEKLSLGDLQKIDYAVNNESGQKLRLKIFDSLPFQFNYRKEVVHAVIESGDYENFIFEFIPKERGRYLFGDINVWMTSHQLRLVSLKKTFEASMESKVLPSIIQMKKYDLYTLEKAAHLFGIKKIRTIGENDEFEVIRNYQQGDFYKSINWKASSRRGELMVNQYQDTRQQEIYCLIDKGRTMELPFEGLSLLDYSINASLVISNIALQKSDRMGLITFGKKIDTFLVADSRSHQLSKILESLYAQATDFQEHNYELLYMSAKRNISKRSILFLYTNFENMVELDRNIQFLQLLSRSHLLVVINFINTTLEEAATDVIATKLSEVYDQAIAQKLYYEKYRIHQELNNRGIQSILTTPEKLTIQVINKYLEIKSKRAR